MLLLFQRSRRSRGLLRGLAAHWSLAEVSDGSGAVTRADSLGSSHLSDPANTPSAAGKLYATAASFTAASNQYLTADNNAALQSGDFDLTVAAWIWQTANTNSAILEKVVAGGAREWLLTMISRKAYYIVSGNGSAISTVSTAAQYALDAWHYVIAWHDASADTINVQVDNGTVASAAHTTGIYAGSAPFRIGRDAVDGFYTNGRVQSVSVWKRLLSAGERADLYRSGYGITYPF